MKFLLLSLALTLLVSCGGSSENSLEESGSTAGDAYEASGLGVPKIGFHRTVSLNYRFANSYEDLTFNPNGNKEVLGDKPFFMFLNEGDKIDLNFYSKQDIKKVSYLKASALNSGTIISNLDISVLNNKSWQDITDFERVFTYRKEFDSEQDMDNKIFIVETEEADLPFVSNSKVMFWLECSASFRVTSCPEGKLKFNYKLLSYSLSRLE